MRQAGLVVHRARAELTVLAAVGVTVLVTTSLLVALITYSGSVTGAGVASVVADAPARSSRSRCRPPR